MHIQTILAILEWLIKIIKGSVDKHADLVESYTETISELSLAKQKETENMNKAKQLFNVMKNMVSPAFPPVTPSPTPTPIDPVKPPKD